MPAHYFIDSRQMNLDIISYLQIIVGRSLSSNANGKSDIRYFHCWFCPCQNKKGISHPKQKHLVEEIKSECILINDDTWITNMILAGDLIFDY